MSRSKKPGASPDGGTPGTPQTPRKPEPGSGPTEGTTARAQPSEPVDLQETAPITPSPHLLSPAHQRFAQEFIVDLNATQAYMRAYPGSTYDTANSEGSRLQQNPAIRSEIQRLLDQRAVITGITADRVLLKWWQTATADPRELVDVRVGACRHCWGLYHEYQYTDRELEREEAKHIHAEAQKRKLAKKQGTEFVETPFHSKGGGGYTPNRQPNPECPDCHGDGQPRSIIRDLREASPGALALFGGIKYDKNGNMTVLVNNDARMKALQNVAEHLGMLTGEARKPAEADSLMQLLQDIQGAHGAGSALAIVHEDPEAKPPKADVQDVVAKPKPEPGSGPRRQWKAVR